LAGSANELIAARAVQGIGGAVVMPLTLTILSAAVPPSRRGVALGAWGGISGLAVAIGPLVGGAVVQGLSWQWIFWLNVPLGLVLIPLAWSRLKETHGANDRLDLPARAVLPDRAGLLAARLRPADPALDGDADLHRADRRCALGQDRRPPDHGARPDAAGRRPRLDRRRHDRDRAVRRSRVPVH